MDPMDRGKRYKENQQFKEIRKWHRLPTAATMLALLARLRRLEKRVRELEGD